MLNCIACITLHTVTKYAFVFALSSNMHHATVTKYACTHCHLICICIRTVTKYAYALLFTLSPSMHLYSHCHQNASSKQQPTCAVSAAVKMMPQKQTYHYSEHEQGATGNSVHVSASLLAFWTFDMSMITHTHTHPHTHHTHTTHTHTHTHTPYIYGSGQP